jgi:hypothetical protein
MSKAHGNVRGVVCDEVHDTRASLTELEGALAVGANFARKEDVQEAAYALFFRRGDSSLQKVCRSNRKHFEVRCTEESCKLKIRTSLRAKSGMWVVKEAELQHSCNVNERTGRQRGVRSDSGVCADLQAQLHWAASGPKRLRISFPPPLGFS